MPIMQNFFCKANTIIADSRFVNESNNGVLERSNHGMFLMHECHQNIYKALFKLALFTKSMGNIRCQTCV